MSQTTTEILVIDDDALFVERVTQLLEGDGYTVRCAANAYEALAAIRNRTPAAILLDVVLPDIEGPALCRLLRQHDHLSQAPIIFTTGREDDRILVACMRAGGDDFIRKSHLPLELPLRLKHHLLLKAERDRLVQRNRELSTLLYFARLLNRSLSLDAVLQSMVEELGQLIGADRCSVILWNENTGRVMATAESVPTGIELDLENYPEVSEALTTRKVVYIPDVLADKRFTDSQRYAFFERRNIQSLLVVPMGVGGALVGTLFVRTTRPNVLAPERVAFCEAGAEIAWRAISNAYLYEHVRSERDALREREPSSDPDELEGLRRLFMDVTAEALQTVGLIQGYSELLLAPEDARRLERRHLRILQQIRGRMRHLEELLRIYPVLPLTESDRPTSMAAILTEIRPTLQEFAREYDVRIDVQIAGDWQVQRGERARRVLNGLVRRLVQELPGNSRFGLELVDDGLIFRCPGGSRRWFGEEFSGQIWNHLLELCGAKLVTPEDEREGAAILVPLVEERGSLP